MKRRILEEWQSYASEVLPADAPDIQIIECRRAFYAGCQATLAVMARLIPGLRQVKDVQSLQDELDESKNYVAGGMA